MKRHFNLLVSVLVVIAMMLTLASCELVNKFFPEDNQPDEQPGQTEQPGGETETPEHTHVFVETVTKEATCYAEGEMKITCEDENCDYEEVKTLEVVAHNETGAAATCTTAKVCANEGCTHVLEAAKGHSLENGLCVNGCENKIAVEVTDTYGWFDEYTFTADAEGYFTFNVPAGLGFWTKDKFDANKAPDLDYNLSPEGGDVVLGIKAGEIVKFYVGAATVGNWTITWSFEAGEIADPNDPGDQPGETDNTLELGNNTIFVPADSFGEAGEYSFTVETEGTYTFASNDLMAVIVIDEITSYRGSAFLTPGTYVVNVVYYTSEAKDCNLNISFEAPATGEPDGSEQFPYIWDTIPESVVLDYDVVSGKVYYIFTATANGSITFTWPVEGDSWFGIDELDANGNNTSNGASGFMKDSHSFVVEAGKSYRVSLGSWSEFGSHTITISAVACDHSWSDATCSAPSTCTNCGAITGDALPHTPNIETPTCNNPQVCTVCNEIIDTAAHEWDYENGDIITPASCVTETNGIIVRKCLNCDATMEFEYYYEHNLVTDAEVSATCTTGGYYNAHCSNEGCTYTYAETYDATGHWSYAYLTCGESGVCDACGENYTKEHEAGWFGVEPTCTEDGQCGNCGEVMPALGHALADVEGKAGTCTEDGYTAHKACGNCDYIEGKEVIAAAHTLIDVDGKDATCIDAGYTAHKACTVEGCGYTEGKTVIDATSEHTWENPTCTVDGYCSVCKAEGESAKGHTYAGSTCADCGICEAVSTPAVGVPYKFGMIQSKVSTTSVYYLTGAMNGYYMATTTNAANAIDVYFEDAGNGLYHLYTIKDDAKVYINMVVSEDGQHVNGVYESTASTYYTYDASKKTVVSIVNGASYWHGTRNDKTFTTVGPCDVSYNGFYCTFYGNPSVEENLVSNHEHNYTPVETAPTCTEAGYVVNTCVCGVKNTTAGADALGHTTEAGTCERCNQEIGGSTDTVGELAVFEFGDDASGAKENNTAATSYSETNNGYTLTLKNLVKVYNKCNDAKGNSVLKLGSSSAVGSFSFTVDDNVTEVVIYVAKYKANTTKINVNGTDYTISASSNNGEYTAIKIDTTTNKTVTFTTVSGGNRCHIDSIVFNGKAK